MIGDCGWRRKATASVKTLVGDHSRCASLHLWAPLDVAALADSCRLREQHRIQSKDLGFCLRREKWIWSLILSSLQLSPSAFRCQHSTLPAPEPRILIRKWKNGCQSKDGIASLGGFIARSSAVGNHSWHLEFHRFMLCQAAAKRLKPQPSFILFEMDRNAELPELIAKNKPHHPTLFFKDK